ncbi:unnamed protein product, partial [Oppiella nova]
MATAMCVDNSDGFDLQKNKSLNNKYAVNHNHTNNKNEDQLDEESVTAKETNIIQTGLEMSRNGKANELADLIRSVRPFLNRISKAKAAKLVRQLVDLFLDMEKKTGHEVQLCEECIDWAKQEKRTFLRQS